MRVSCIAATGEGLPDSYMGKPYGLDAEVTFRLTPGKEYVVYAVAFDRSGVWYFLLDDAQLWYPNRYPSPLFRTVDPRLPPVWEFAVTPSHADHLALLAPAPWTRDRYFFDRLTDRAPAEVAVFSALRKAIDAASTHGTLPS